MAKAVLLDSGFLIRLMNPAEPLHQVAFVSADAEAKKVYDLLESPDFEFVNIRELE